MSTINGNSLTSIKFYPNYDYTTTKTYIVYLKEVTEETFSGTTFYTESDATTVYSGGLTISATDGLTIHFSTTFDYNGGNLLVGFYLAEDASGYGPSTCPFYGISASGASISQYGSYSASQRNFLPKATFEYEVNAYPKPKNLAVTNLTANGATITWEAPNTNVQSYKYQYREQGGTWSALTSTTDLSVPLTSLTGNTTYEFQVQAIYAGDNESGFASKSFTTECGAFSIPYEYGFEDANDMNCWTIANDQGRMSLTSNDVLNNYFCFKYTLYWRHFGRSN